MSTQLIKGNVFADDRGELRFINDFDPTAAGVRRFYQVENVRAGYVRAWHGHANEGKFVYVPRGAAKVAVIHMDNATQWIDYWSGKFGVSDDNPIQHPELGPKLYLEQVVLSSTNPEVFYIPPGYYNGFKTLKEDTIVMFFSTSPLEHSSKDDFRLDWDVFGKDVWEENFR